MLRLCANQQNPNKPTSTRLFQYKWNIKSPLFYEIAELNVDTSVEFGLNIITSVGRDSSIGIASRYGLDGPEIKSR
jgi:hypothetical protein